MTNGRSSEPDQPAPRLDALDRRLITELQGDARMAYATLGSRLGVTGMTAANRLQRLRNNNLLRFRVAPRFEEYGLTTEVLGLLQADVGAHERCLAVLENSNNVLRVDRVTGEYDLSFSAVFPNEAAMGALVRELQSLSGIRRLVVHHCLSRAKDEDGWAAVWAEPAAPEDLTFEIAPGVRVPEHLRAKVTTAAQWLIALTVGDTETVKAVSDDEVTYTIMPPQAGSGTFEGMDAVLGETELAGSVFRQLWHRIVGVSEADDPYDIVVDSYNTAERRKGSVRTAFARIAFGFVNGRVRRVVSLGQMDLPDLPESETGAAARRAAAESAAAASETRA
jgi:Lrp/AsnC family transcriptional regulator for asnA, asnC and gidA